MLLGLAPFFAFFFLSFILYAIGSCISGPLTPVKNFDKGSPFAEDKLPPQILPPRERKT
jgi:hypothetical protein